MSNQNVNSAAAPENAARNGGLAAATAGAVKPGNAPSYADRADPEALLLSMSRSVFPRMIAWSAIFHVLLIGLSSINFIQLCVKYDSLHPRQVIKQIERDEAEKKTKADEEARVKAAQEALKKKMPATAEKNGPGAAVQTPAGTTPDSKGPEKPKSKIEQELEKTSTERPNKPSINLDNANDLE